MNNSIWGKKVENAISLLEKKRYMLRALCDFWSSPFYRWFRTKILKKQPAIDEFEFKDRILLIRKIKIIQRYKHLLEKNIMSIDV